MSTRNGETANWVRWLMGIIIGALIVLASYIGTAMATTDYHDADMRRSKESHDEIQMQRDLRWDERQTAILSAIEDLKED